MTVAHTMPIAPPPIKIPFTKAAYEAMQAELERLTQERKAVIERLQTAREMGDLSENGAYKYAKIELGSIGRQLRELSHLLKNGEITAKTTNPSQVGFGSSVTLQRQDTGIKTTFLIVSTHESDPLEHKLSTESPIGQAIEGKKLGDTVLVQTPAGPVQYTIVALS